MHVLDEKNKVMESQENELVHAEGAVHLGGKKKKRRNNLFKEEKMFEH